MGRRGLGVSREEVDAANRISAGSHDQLTASDFVR